MLSEESLELFSKCPMPVVLFLILDVRNRVRHTGLSDAEGAIPFLPPEQAGFGKRLADPLGRVSFEDLNPLGNGERGGERQKHVDVVGDAAYGQRVDVDLASNAAKVRKETFPEPR